MMVKVNKKARKFSSEFKEFTGSKDIMNTAVGIMIGAALKDTIDSLVNNVLTPPINYLTSGIDLSNMFFVLSTNSYDDIELAKKAGEVVIEYGKFLSSLASFLIMALVLFIVVRQSKKAFKKDVNKEEKAKTKTTKDCPYCLSEIHIKATKCPYCTSKVN